MQGVLIIWCFICKVRGGGGGPDALGAALRAHAPPAGLAQVHGAADVLAVPVGVDVRARVMPTLASPYLSPPDPPLVLELFLVFP